MTKPFQGKIELDIRDSVPDWEPFLAPKAPDGAPNVLLIAWDDLGYATMDIYGGPVETPEHASHRRARRACSPTSTPPPCARPPEHHC